jgi:hypothetical protein
MSAQIEQLVEQAGRLASSGRWDEAERVWIEIRRRDPQHPRALFSLGVHALKRGDGVAAHDLLTAARKLAPSDVLVLMTLCAACQHPATPRRTRSHRGGACRRRLFSPALLAKQLARALGRARARHDVRERAQGGANKRNGPRTSARSSRMRAFAAAHAEDLDASRALLSDRCALPPSLAARWREAA